MAQLSRKTGPRLRRRNSATRWTHGELLPQCALATRGRQRVEDGEDLPGKNLTKRGMKWNCGHPGESLSKSGPGGREQRGYVVISPGQRTACPLKDHSLNREVAEYVVTPYLSGSSHTAPGCPGTGRMKTTRALAHSSSGRERTPEMRLTGVKGGGVRLSMLM